MDLVKRFNITVPDRLNESQPVLVIDNQNDMRMIVVHQLGKLTFSNVLQSSDAMEALDRLRETSQTAAIICSMDLPGLTGLDMLAEMREDVEVTRPPFCLTMANVSKEKLMFAVESGVDEILVKPYTLADIVPKLRRAFASFHNPKNPEKVYELAKCKLRDEDPDAAQEIYQALHESASSSARPLVGLARVAIAKGDPTLAFELLDKAQVANEHYVHTYAVRGQVLADQKDYDQSIAMFKKAIKLSPLNPVRYDLPCQMLLSQDKFEEVIDLLSIARQNEVVFARMYHYLSQAHYYLKEYPKSAKYIKKALDKDPDNTTYLNQLALSLKESGELDEARKVYNNVIKIDPDNQQALFNKAIMLAQAEKTDEAVKILGRLVEKYPDFDKAKNKLRELKGE